MKTTAPSDDGGAFDAALASLRVYHPPTDGSYSPRPLPAYLLATTAARHVLGV